MRTAHRTMLLGAALALCLAALAGCGGSGGGPGASPGGTVTASSAAVTEQQVIAFVQKAAEHVKAVGKEQALADFSDPDGQFRDGELYILAEDFEGNELASGGQPELVGQNILDVQDPNGVYLVKELISTARDKGSGWVSYVWDNPETGEQQDKRAYVIKAGDDWYVARACTWGRRPPAPGKRNVMSSQANLLQALVATCWEDEAFR